MAFFKFKTLQGRLLLLLLVPVFLILAVVESLSFFYTRAILLNQWEESAVLKLQRAAHHIEMRLLKPLEFIRLVYGHPEQAGGRRFQSRMVKQIESLDGVVNVDFVPDTGGTFPGTYGDRPEDTRNYRIDLNTSTYDVDAETETVKVTLFPVSGKVAAPGTIEVTLNIDSLLSGIKTLGWWQGDKVCIVDDQGRYVIHTEKRMNHRRALGETMDATELAVFAAMKHQHFGTVKTGGHPPETIAGFYRLQQVPWTVIIFARGDRVLAPIVRYRNLFFAMTLVVVGCVLLLIRVHVGNIARKVKQLADNSVKVTQGHYGPPVPESGLDELGQLVHQYNAMVAGLRERDLIRNSFGRYVDPEFARMLMSRPGSMEIGGHEKDVAILMSDIRGFTSLVEVLPPGLVLKVLNRYLSCMIQIIQQHQGIIVDFFGDGILVFFEPMDMTIEKTLLRSIDCAQAMQEAMPAINQSMAEILDNEMAIGIGIHSGRVIVGNIGSETRTKYGIVGSAVNLTQRVQSRAGRGEIVLTGSALIYVRQLVRIQRSFAATLKGLHSPVELHVIDRVSASSKPLSH